MQEDRDLEPGMQAFEVTYHGRVQGVGFRWTTKTIATEEEVFGTVRNLSDGSVFVFAQGAPSRLRRFLVRLEESFDGLISKTTKREITPMDSCRSFEITV